MDQPAMSKDESMPAPTSCDTLVALPPATNGYIIFGKNSDRPGDEVHEVVYKPAATYKPGDKVQCTYIEIDQAPNTYAVVLSKPAWMWGAEMGANDQGVCIGNEAVWTKLNGPDDLTERLLGMDLLRLGLERGGSAKESVEIITFLLANHGQGGPCIEDGTLSYHNSFLIADTKEAWILETAGDHWVAQKVTEGVRNISNQLTITTDFDLSSPNLIEEATAMGYYSPDQGPFNFAKVFAIENTGDFMSDTSRYSKGKKLLEDLSKNGTFGVQDMMKILRDEDSGINMGYRTKSSQVSMLPMDVAGATSVPGCHWLTSTPDPACSMFKPFIFGPNTSTGKLTLSPDYGDKDPRVGKPRFKVRVNRENSLYSSQKKLREWLVSDEAKGHAVLQNVQELELNCIADVEEILKNWEESSFIKVSHLFEHMCEIELLPNRKELGTNHRLGLERGGSAKESVEIITSLLASHGQGGPCSEGGNWSYHNSFLIADTKEAWILETAGDHWVAQKVTEGVRNISNQLTITTDFDLSSPNLIEEATAMGYYSSDQGPFNFAKVFADDYEEELLCDTSRYYKGKKLLEELSKNGTFGVQDMMKVLRDGSSGINMGYGTKSSQVSMLPVDVAGATSVPACHWLTSTPDPACSMFKPFIFGPNTSTGKLTLSPDYGDEDPRVVKPRFKVRVNRENSLYSSQKKLREWLVSDEAKGQAVLQNVQELESNCIADVEEILKNWEESSFIKVSHLFEHMCEIEVNFYK